MGKFKLWDGKFIPMFEPEEWGAAEDKPYRQFECTEFPISFVRFCYDDMLTKYNTTETIVALQECQREHMDIGYEDMRYK